MNQRDCLSLHVRTHQGAGSVIVFNERNQSRRNRQNLLWGDVNQIHFFRCRQDIIPRLSTANHIPNKIFVLIKGCIPLRDCIIPFLHRRKINHFIRDMAFFDEPIRGFDKPIRIHKGIGRQGIDQTNVGTFRCFHRTNSPVMGWVHIPHLQACAITGQPPRTQGRNPPLMGDF